VVLFAGDLDAEPALQDKAILADFGHHMFASTAMANAGLVVGQRTALTVNHLTSLT
jgi:hypothetical protein